MSEAMMENEVSFEYVVSIRPKKDLNKAVRYQAPANGTPAKLSLADYRHEDMAFHFGVQVLAGGLVTIFPSGGNLVAAYKEKPQPYSGIDHQIYFEPFDSSSTTQGWWLSVDFLRKSSCMIAARGDSNATQWSIHGDRVIMGTTLDQWELRKVSDD